MDLLRACIRGDIATLRSVADISIETLHKPLNESGDTPIIVATQHNCVEVVEFLLEHTSPNLISPSGRTVLIEAASRGYKRMLRILLERGAYVDGRDFSKDTPLIVASREGFEGSVRLLLHSNAFVDAINAAESTAIMEAAKNGHKDVVHLLYLYGADPERTDFRNWSALMLAISNGHADIAKLFLSWYVDLSVVETWHSGGRTALMLAAREGMFEVVEGIMNRIDFNLFDAQTSTGKTALMYACQRGCIKSIDALVQNCANVDIIDEDGLSALVHAIVCNNHKAALYLLEFSCVDPNPVYYRGPTTALIEASKRGMSVVVRFLIRKGARVNDVGSHGSTALMWACNYRFGEVVRHLVEAGAYVNMYNHLEWSALMYAAAYSDTKICDMLLDAGASPHAPGLETPLLLCVGNPAMNAVSVRLVEAGADIHAPNTDGHTALHIAINHDNVEMVTYLLNKNATVASDGSAKLLVDYLQQLKHDRESLLQVFPHALALSRGA